MREPIHLKHKQYEHCSRYDYILCEKGNTRHYTYTTEDPKKVTCDKCKRLINEVNEEDKTVF